MNFSLCFYESSKRLYEKVVIENRVAMKQLKIREFPLPKPGHGEVLIEVHACGVNFADCCVRMGVYRSAKEFVGWPITPGFEAAGVITQVGAGVTKFMPGQKVIAITLFGGYVPILWCHRTGFPLPRFFIFGTSSEPSDYFYDGLLRLV